MQNSFTLHTGDALEVLRTMPDNSVDSVVTDPPYGLAFMGKKWDYDVPETELWAEVLRVLKPGGHLLAFAGTRTQHRMAVRIEDAGFEIRDMIAWVYGSGFPKSNDFARETVEDPNDSKRTIRITRAEFVGHPQERGWGTALKPALEPITVARKPFSQTVAANVLEWGTGGLNVDGCRVGEEVRYNAPAGSLGNGVNMAGGAAQADREGTTATGRWPANLIHDGSDEVLDLFPQTGAGHRPKTKTTGFGEFGGGASEYHGPGPKTDKGSAARFFYCAKAQKKDREEGLDGFEMKDGGSLAGGNDKRNGKDKPQMTPRANHHPTVKPTDLMAYLCRLITPPGGLILDPFMGSGTTGKAAVREGFRFVGIDLSPEYTAIARARIEHEAAKHRQARLPFAAE